MRSNDAYTVTPTGEECRFLYRPGAAKKVRHVYCGTTSLEKEKDADEGVVSDDLRGVGQIGN